MAKAGENKPEMTYAEAKAFVQEEDRKRDEELLKKQKEAERPKVFVPGRYVCVNKCYHKKLYIPGEVVEFTDQDPAPLEPGPGGRLYVNHFKLIED